MVIPQTFCLCPNSRLFALPQHDKTNIYHEAKGLYVFALAITCTALQRIRSSNWLVLNLLRKLLTCSLKSCLVILQYVWFHCRLTAILFVWLVSQITSFRATSCFRTGICSYVTSLSWASALLMAIGVTLFSLLQSPQLNLQSQPRRARPQKTTYGW